LTVKIDTVQLNTIRMPFN